MGSGWDPGRYDRFRAEREAPFHDLVALLDPVPGGRAVDLGCGTGALTAELHRRIGAAETIGIDSSADMLARSAAHAGDGVRFVEDDISTVDAPDDLALVFSNAAFQWLPDHVGQIERWAAALGPGGQLALQVPANADHASHVVAAEVAQEQPFVDAFGGEAPTDPVLGVLRPEHYAELLHDLGFAGQHVRLQVYGHLLGSTADVVEWVRGTTLTRFARRLPAEVFEDFVEQYRRRLLDELGDRSPYFYAFKRILLWARR
jgi:trans-aconitate 2-methyltransferase